MYVYIHCTQNNSCNSPQIKVPVAFALHVSFRFQEKRKLNGSVLFIKRTVIRIPFYGEKTGGIY